jgi:hypothetical protein
VCMDAVMSRRSEGMRTRGRREARGVSLGALVPWALAACTPLSGVEPDVIDVYVEAPAPPPPAPIGTRCTRNSECGAGMFCSEIPGGFCTRPCPNGDECGPDAVCGGRTFCYKRCNSTADCGERGWICLRAFGTQRVCEPDCDFDPAGVCGAEGCSADGYCLPACSMFAGQTLICSAGSTCTAPQGGRCRCTSSTNCGDNRRCVNGACARIE